VVSAVSSFECRFQRWESFSAEGVVSSVGCHFQRRESFPALGVIFGAECRFQRSNAISPLGVVSSVGLSFSVQIAVFSADRRFPSWVLCVVFRQGSVSFSGLGVVFSAECHFQL
jgi:hypothetical protein